MPEHFGKFDFDPATLARRSIEDMYVDRTVPWVDDPQFVAEVDKFIDTLPASSAAEAFAYRDECRARMQQADKAAHRGQADARMTNRCARVALRLFAQGQSRRESVCLASVS